jgi:hypothetical protein
MNSTPPPPKPITDENGRTVHSGSLNVGDGLSGRQKDDIAKKLKEKPHTPVSLATEVDGLHGNDHGHVELVRRHLSMLERNGKIQKAHDSNGNLLGWQDKGNE